MKRIRRSAPEEAAVAVTTNSIGDDDEEVEQRTAPFCFGAAETPQCLVRELQQMPTAKREQATAAVLGVSSNLDDIPLESLEQLEEEIAKLENKAEYDLAMELDSNYTKSLHLTFLRSVEGKPKQAAKRITRHFQTKLNLFGRDKLVKPIELSDFDEHDLEALYSGGFQVLSRKDRAGRPILFGRYTCMKYRDIKNIVSGKIKTT
jgi:hypothetical protein